MHNLNSQVREYFSRVTEDGLSVPRCGTCNTNFLPPRALCPSCGSAELGWLECQNPEATIYSLTRMKNGKTIAVVELDVVDGPGRLYLEVVGPGASNASIGDRVVVSTREQEFQLGNRVPVVAVGAAD